MERRRHTADRVLSEPWIDLVGETAFGYTRQSNDFDTRELTPRIGFRLNVLNNLREREHFAIHPLGRVRLATLVRFEYRNFWYSDGSPSQHTWRFRARVEVKFGINHADYSHDKSLYGIFDAEAFVPLGEGVSERFASKTRMRTGLGYRLRYATRSRSSTSATGTGTRRTLRRNRRRTLSTSG